MAKHSLSKLVEELCEKRGYRRAFTKKAYWANRRLELSSHLLEVHPKELSSLDIVDVTRHLATPVFDVVSYVLGVVFGRWDVRIACGEVTVPNSRDPFAAVPACPPGMLVDDGLRAKTAPEGYPLPIAWDGIVVDDHQHQDDIVRRVQSVIEVIWKGRSEAVEDELCERLRVKSLGEYFRRPSKGGFWDNHVGRYRKSRRSAPIYWLLQSSKKSYAIWLYYHRLDKDEPPRVSRRLF
jgi:hypothetical protein